MSLARILLVFLLAAAPASAESPSAEPPRSAVEARGYSPSVADDFPTRVFWGDTHVHTAFSMDANAMGDTRLTPEEAYRFARGEAVRANNGMMARLEVPLDFLVVADHSEYMGLLPRLREGDPGRSGRSAIDRELEGGRAERADDAACSVAVEAGPEEADRQRAVREEHVGAVHGARRSLRRARTLHHPRS